MADIRSPLAVKIMNANPRAYEALVVVGPTPALARQLLDGVQPDQLLSEPAASSAHARAMLAGLWLWHDALAESHAISQSLHDATGSFWHAIMHRREGDFSNSKYWYARAAGHPSLNVLAAQAAPLLAEEPADRLLLGIVVRGFDPNALVDLVEIVHKDPHHPQRGIAVALQQLEWRVLFNTPASK